MQLTRRIRHLRPLLVILLVCCLSSVVQAAESMQVSRLPVLLGKSPAIGYALVFLCILLGLLAVTIPSMRKPLRKKDTY